MNHDPPSYQCLVCRDTSWARRFSDRAVELVKHYGDLKLHDGMDVFDRSTIGNPITTVVCNCRRGANAWRLKEQLKERDKKYQLPGRYKPDEHFPTWDEPDEAVLAEFIEWCLDTRPVDWVKEGAF